MSSILIMGFGKVVVRLLVWILSAGDTENGSENEDDSKPIESIGYTLEFDAAHKITQCLGTHLNRLTTLVEIKGGKVRLLPVSERAHSLFVFGYCQSLNG